MNRRQFLHTSAMFAAGYGYVALAQSSATERNLSIGDTHQHLWNLSQFRLPWLQPSGELARDFTMADYKEAIRGLGITKAIYMEVAVVSEQQLAEAENIVKVCEDKSNPTCAAVIGGPILDGDFKDYIFRFRGSPYIKGVRHSLNNLKQLEDGQLIQNLRLLGTVNMSFDLLIPPRLIDRAAKLVEQCGQTRFILDHCIHSRSIAIWIGVESLNTMRTSGKATLTSWLDRRM